MNSYSIALLTIVCFYDILSPQLFLVEFYAVWCFLLLFHIFHTDCVGILALIFFFYFTFSCTHAHTRTDLLSVLFNIPLSPWQLREQGDDRPGCFQTLTMALALSQQHERPREKSRKNKAVIIYEHVYLFFSVEVQELVKSPLSGASNSVTASSLSFKVLKLIPEKGWLLPVIWGITDFIPSQSILEQDTEAQIVPKAMLNEQSYAKWT